MCKKSSKLLRQGCKADELSRETTELNVHNQNSHPETEQQFIDPPSFDFAVFEIVVFEIEITGESVLSTGWT
jgi:hypothetical protein